MVSRSCTGSARSAPGKRSPPGTSQPGRPLGELEAVIRRAGRFETTDIPQWRCLLVRTWSQNAEPDYDVVADGHWLVFDVSLSVLYTLADEEFSGEFEPAAPQPVP